MSEPGSPGLPNFVEEVDPVIEQAVLRE